MITILGVAWLKSRENQPSLKSHSAPKHPFRMAKSARRTIRARSSLRQRHPVKSTANALGRDVGVGCRRAGGQHITRHLRPVGLHALFELHSIASAWCCAPEKD